MSPYDAILSSRILHGELKVDRTDTFVGRQGPEYHLKQIKEKSVGQSIKQEAQEVSTSSSMLSDFICCLCNVLLSSKYSQFVLLS